MLLVRFTSKTSSCYYSTVILLHSLEYIRWKETNDESYFNFIAAEKCLLCHITDRTRANWNTHSGFNPNGLIFSIAVDITQSGIPMTNFSADSENLQHIKIVTVQKTQRFTPKVKIYNSYLFPNYYSLYVFQNLIWTRLVHILNYGTTIILSNRRTLYNSRSAPK